MIRRALAAAVGCGVALTVVPPGGADDRLPVYEPGVVEQVPAAPCVADPSNPYEATSVYGPDGASVYGAACRRLRFVFGPIHVRPGQNDVLIEPVTIHKPAYPGFIVRFKPDLVDATGRPPGIEEVHLHHATWLNGNDAYGNAGIFFATGEEKTIATWPRGYGMLVEPDDVWLLLYMVHNETAIPREVWITYEIDFVSKAANDALPGGHPLKIAPTRPIWLDVGAGRIQDPKTGRAYPNAPSNGGNPVFNVQRGFGHLDDRIVIGGHDLGPGVGTRVCRWPAENCARHNWLGDPSPAQGVEPYPGEPVQAVKDWTVDDRMAGTLVLIGGHLHPGGIRDEVSIVRDGVEKPIHISDAVYWRRDDTRQAGGPQTSWDFSMTGTSADLGWKVKVRPGDRIRLNAVYDSSQASWYENMGIVMAWVAPQDPHGPPGVDVFADPVALDPGVPAGAAREPGATGGRERTCVPGAATLCLRGQVTHGHLPEASTFGGCGAACQPLTPPDGPVMTDIAIANFSYGPASPAVFDLQGIPRVRVGTTVRFWNLDTVADIWHTVTRCREPCTGRTGLDYPLADGGTATNPTEAWADTMDFDSTEIGYGTIASPASGRLDGQKPTQEAVRDGLYWEFTPTRTGDFTFFCRIHPEMRGAIRVVP